MAMLDAFVSWGWDFFGSARASSAVVDPDAARIDWGDEDDVADPVNADGTPAPDTTVPSSIGATS